MKKETCSKKRHLSKTILFTLTIILSLFLFVPQAKAQATDACDFSIGSGQWWHRFKFKKNTYCKVKEFVAENIDISETVNNVFVSTTQDVPLGIMLNTNADDIGVCGAYYLIEEVERTGGVLSKNDQGGISICPAEYGATSQIIDADGLEKIVEFSEERLDCDYNSMELGSRSSGSFAGVATLAFQTAASDPVPVNLAYYAKHNLQKVPVIGNTAFAQTSIYDTFGLRLILQIWEVSRNVAYALISVIMLVVGIMISTRRKISPQLVVTAQTAIPRIVISLLLITFSYPIGAVFAASVMPLTFTVIKVFLGDFLESIYTLFAGQPGQLVNINLLVVVAGIVMAMAGSAGTGVLLGILLIILTLVALLVAGVKLLIVNVKILLNIITAPITFAFAAIPGQEHLITDWFKQMAAKVLAIPAMVFMIALGWYLLLKPFTSAETLQSIACINFANLSSLYTSFGFMSFLLPASSAMSSMAVTFIMLILMAIMTMFVGLKADKKIEEFIMGGSQGGGKGGKR